MNETFINPYTFIPVSKGVKKEYSDYFSEPLITGKISCVLKTKTQISVCDFGANEREHEFFSIDGTTPVIPGSSLRGVIRSIYESLTDSCFCSVNADDDDYFSSRMNKQKTGLLVRENGVYVLYEAKRSKDDNNWITEDMKTGDKVCFDEYIQGNISYVDGVNNEDGNQFEGFIHKVDTLETKRREKTVHNYFSVFRKQNRIGEIDSKYIERFKVNVDRYTPNDAIRGKEYKAAFKNMYEKEGVFLPCWYIKENGHYYFAPSQMSRSIYANKPIDLLKKQGLDKCISRSNVCEACSVFGTINETKSGSITVPSRLRFGDAICVSPEPLDRIYKLPILAQPRLSSFEFYLINSEDSFGADDEKTRIAGRKYYWHNNKANITKDAVNKEGNKMDESVRLIKPGKEFRFEVFFDRITEKTLKKLIFAINLGENSIDGNYCHKIGHGKPIGLGSVKIAIEEIKIRSFANGFYTEKDMTELASSDLSSEFSSATNISNIRRVTDFNAVNGALIGYPTIESGNTEIFKWFAENRGSFSRGKPQYKQKLPRIDANPAMNRKSPEFKKKPYVQGRKFR